MDIANSNIGVLFFAVLIIIGIFIILREFATWYWKINRVVQTLEDINMQLASLNKHLKVEVVEMDEDGLNSNKG